MDPDRYNPAAQDQLIAWYADASARLQDLVLNPPGGTAAGREFRQARAAQLIAQVDAILARLNQQTTAWAGRHALALYRLARARADLQAREWGIRTDAVPAPSVTLQGSLSLVNNAAVGILARNAVGELRAAAGSMATRTKGLIKDLSAEGIDNAAVNRILAGGVIEGLREPTYRRLKEELERVSGGQTINVNGRNYTAEYYAEMVVRTRTREAMESARHERLGELGIDLVTIVGRVSTNPCTGFLGKIFSISGKSDKYPSLSSLPGDGPPFHPNCTKSTAPFIEELASEAEIRVGSDNADVLQLARAWTRQGPAAAQRTYQDLQLREQAQAGQEALAG